jgi:hypothetical protein
LKVARVQRGNKVHPERGEKVENLVYLEVREIVVLRE